VTQRHCYLLAERTIACDWALPELVENKAPDATRVAPEMRIVFPDEPAPRDGEWFHSWVPKGEPEDTWLRFGTMPGGYLLDFPGYGRFSLSTSGKDLRCFPVRDTPAPTTRHLLLDQVIPLAFNLMGDVVVHACALVHDEQAIAIVAASGSGKSTTAAYLGTHGAQVLTDDCLVLRQASGTWHAFPYYHGMRLWPDDLARMLPDSAGGEVVSHYTDKLRVSSSPHLAYRSSSAPLRAIISLPEAAVPPARVELASLAPRAAFFEILQATFSFEVREKLALRQQFERVSQLVEAVPAFALAYRRDFDLLPDVRAAILSALRQ
jgi:hypothetical protein